MHRNAKSCFKHRFLPQIIAERGIEIHRNVKSCY